MRELNKVLERRMQEELSAWRDAGGDVDRLVMKALLAKVQESGPNTAFKALASIEVREGCIVERGTDLVQG